MRADGHEPPKNAAEMIEEGTDLTNILGSVAVGRSRRLWNGQFCTDGTEGGTPGDIVSADAKK